jgi:hypothetical protein
MQVSFKNYTTVLIEAIVVGIGLVVLVELLKKLPSFVVLLSDKALPPREYKNQMILLFVAGFIFHILCEYTGVNSWYAKNYCKLIV